MSWITILSFSLCLFLIVISFRKRVDIFSPWRIFAIVWSFAFGLTDLKLSWLQHEWQIGEWVLVLIGPISFLLGCTFVYVLNIGNNIFTLEYLRKNKTIYKINETALLHSIVVLFILFLFGYVLIFLKTQQIPLFSAKPWKARVEFTMFGVGLFLHNVILIVFLTTTFFLLAKKNIRKRIGLLFLSFTSVILYSITLQRYQIFFALFLVGILLYYTTFYIKFKTAFISSILIIGFFFLISSLRAGELIIYLLYSLSKMKFSPEYAIFTEPYMYVVMNLENYARAVAHVQSFTYGYYTFDFMTAIFGIKKWIHDYYSLVENPFLVSTYNTYTGFWTYYRDFGVLGIFIIPFTGGFLISKLYYSFRRKPTLLKLTIYGMFLFGIIFSFFSSPFGYLWFVYDIIIVIVIFKIITLRENPLN